jgi:uncharacterized radical SAM superfamily Fe-S cluster-containing enzyme
MQEISTPIKKQDADYVFYELTRTLCPECRKVVDGHVLIRENKVYIRRRCPDHGVFEGLVYGDAKAYVANSKYNKPGTIPLKFTTEIVHGCPHRGQQRVQHELSTLLCKCHPRV